MGESAHRKTGDEIMSTKSKIVLSFGLFLAAVSAAAAAPHQANIHTSQLGVAQSYGGYSSDPKTRALELVADKYHGWAEYLP
jgi:hypothetical protein